MLSTTGSQTKKKSHFWQSLRHELKTPLVNIKALPQLIEWEKIDGDNKLFLEESLSAAQELGTKMDRIFEAWQLETEPLTIQTEIITLEAFIKNIHPPKNLCIHYPKNLTQKIKVDVPLMRKAWKEIINNAAFFNTEESRLHITVTKEKQKIIMKFQDNGIGIAPEHQKSIFDMLFVVSKSRNQVESGTGVGLAITQHIIQAHGGTIEVTQSEKNKGTTLQIEIPT